MIQGGGVVHTRLPLVIYGDWVYLYVCMSGKTWLLGTGNGIIN